MGSVSSVFYLPASPHWTCPLPMQLLCPVLLSLQGCCQSRVLKPAHQAKKTTCFSSLTAKSAERIVWVKRGRQRKREELSREIYLLPNHFIFNPPLTHFSFLSFFPLAFPSLPVLYYSLTFIGFYFSGPSRQDRKPFHQSVGSFISSCSLH